ncbi:MAG: extracellular catalytic domain type 1 short-chain-length polyhydroxyalkanoate depolymerase [Pseudomarimonas sp.]
MRMRIWFTALAVLLLCASAQAQTLTEVTGFGSNPGNLKMFKIVPSGLPANAPVVVALHGCAQSAAAYDVETGWVLLANRWKFALVLPQQQSGNNSSSCFNWFETADISRGSGEALSIRQMVTRILSDHGGDPARVYVTGLSAGGAMTSTMLATYPEVFAGGAIVAGVPHNCGIGTTAAFSCMNPGSDLTPAQWGNKVRAASSHSGPWPIVSIWHGASDSTVRPVNLTESMEQWTNVHGIDQVAEVEDTLGGFPRKQYKTNGGALRVETVLITGMGHGTPVDPGTAETQCGTAGAYILDVNLCSSYWIGRFWGLDNLDSLAPQVSVSAPANGAAVSGFVNVSAAASDNVGVDRVEFLLDGALLGSDDSTPYAISWNSANSVNGAHTLQARAIDLAGNVGSSAAVTVTVSGGQSDTAPPTVDLTFPTTGATLSGTVTLSADASDNFGVVGVEFLLNGTPIGNASLGVTGGPWTLAWNSSSVADGDHSIRARATDAAGNSSLSAISTVTVTQNLPALDETFSNRDGNGDYFDASGWTGGFASNAANATVGVGGSQSTYGAASSGISCVTGLKTQFLTRSVSLGSAPQLSYARRLDLKANTNSSYSAAFQVSVNGSMVDQQAVTNSSFLETDWVRREGISLAAWAGQTITLRFEARASANVCIEAYARAFVDDIRIQNAQAASDTTPPVVNLTTPTTAATLSGTVQLSASASDANGIAKVEFYANGSLLGQTTSAPFQFNWVTASVADGSYALMAKAYDPAGNTGSDDDTVVSVDNATTGGGGSVVASLASVAAEDGYTKANATGGSTEVGTLEASYGLALGRGSDAKYNRALLSFDTSTLPATAQIVAARLTLTHRGASGNPWTNPTGNRLLIDIRSGCFGTTCSLIASDHGATASATAIAEVTAFTSGTRNSTAFDASGLAAINRSGRTQLRLRFEANQSATHYVWMGSGTQATLEVEYVMP